MNGLVTQHKDSQPEGSGTGSEEGIGAGEWERKGDRARGEESGGQMEGNPKINSIFYLQFLKI